MKFVHIADMHFDSPFSLLASRASFGELRRLDQRKVFKKIIEYIKENNIEYLFIAGDLYEQEYIRLSTIEYINNLFKEINNTKIYITPGNHDPILNNSFYKTFNWNSNVKIFNEELEVVETDDAYIYGYGFNDFHMSNKYEFLDVKNDNKLNILITHGDLSGDEEDYYAYNGLQEKHLKESKFNYIALGHIHKRSYNDYPGQKIVYPGSTISLGFDEQGSHGMIVGELTKDDLKIEYIPLDEKEFVEINLDVENINSIEELIEKINELNCEEKYFYKLILIGKRKIEININKLFKLLEIKNLIKIKDKTILDYNLKEIANDYSLKGIFVNEILNKLNNEEIDKEVVEKAIEIGMDIL